MHATRKRKSLSQSIWQRLLLLLAIVAAGTMAQAQITPSADSYTNTADPTTNFGAATLLNVDGATEKTYIQFDVLWIPPGVSIDRALLKLYVNSVTTPGTFNVDYVSGQWMESTITADLAPSLGNNITATSSITTADKNQYLLLDITSAVQAWLDGNQVNYGLALVANGNFSASFDSKENTGTSHPPELDIVYTPGAGGLTGVTTSAGSGLTGGGTSGTLALSLSTSCASLQVLQWNGTAWVCASPTGKGTITEVIAGTGLTGGGSSGNVTLNLNTSSVPLLGSANTFTTSQSIAGNLNLSGNLNLPITPGTGNEGVVMLGPTPFLHNYGLSGSYNTFVGGAGNFLLSGGGITGVGYLALASDTSGFGNTAVGYEALKGDSAGFKNTSVGDYAGLTADSSLITGNYNSFLGEQTALSTGSLNNATAIGADAEVGESNAIVLGCVSGTNGCSTTPNVGIGTTTPAYSLDIANGNAMVRGVGNFTGAGQTAAVYVGDINHPIEAAYGVGFNFRTFNADNPVQIPDNGADLWADSYNVWATQNVASVQTLAGALEKITQLRGVSYERQSDGKPGMGMLPQEVAEVAPEIVGWDKSGEKAKGVNYTGLTTLLLEAIKEQQQLIEKQQAQINDLATQLKMGLTALKTNGQINSSQLPSNSQPAQ